MPRVLTPCSLFVLLSLCACASTSGPGNGNGAGGGSASCPTPGLFQDALCVCGDLDHVGALDVEAGPSGTGDVGVNGVTNLGGLTHVAGSWSAYGGFGAVASATIDGDVVTPNDASWVGILGIGGDLDVGGNVTGLGLATIGGALQVGGNTTLIAGSLINSRGNYVAPAGAPCGCDKSQLLDVAAAVAAAQAQNDDAAVGLTGDLTTLGLATIKLGAGTYYLPDATIIGQLHLDITGKVGLYVDGVLDALGPDDITLEPGATLDLFVSGGIGTLGLLGAGNAADPQALRIYIGGTNAVALSFAAQAFYGSIYAPEAAITWGGITKVVGSVFANTLTGLGLLEIDYGAPADSSCDQPGGSGDPGPLQ